MTSPSGGLSENVYRVIYGTLPFLECFFHLQRWLWEHNEYKLDEMFIEANHGSHLPKKIVQMAAEHRMFSLPAAIFFHFSNFFGLWLLFGFTSCGRKLPDSH